MPPSPQELAQQALASMALRAIVIQMVPNPAPGSVGLVGMPVWMWTTPTPTTFGPLTRTASAGPVTVSATARVKRVVWRMGDGDVETCYTAGTPYRDAYGKKNSPDCGHTYTRTSRGKAGGRYPVSATSYWSVDWAGGGQSGSIPIDFTSATSVQIGELQVLVTR